MAEFATKSYGMIRQLPSGYCSVEGIKFTASIIRTESFESCYTVKSLGEGWGGRCRKVEP